MRNLPPREERLGLHTPTESVGSCSLPQLWPARNGNGDVKLLDMETLG